jgi:hypothetical protein
MKNFDLKNASLITAYSQTMSRSGVNSVTAQNRAKEVLLTADGPEAYRAGVNALLQEMEVVQQAVRDVEADTGIETSAGGGGAATGGGGGKELHYDSQGNLVQ